MFAKFIIRLIGLFLGGDGLRVGERDGLLLGEREGEREGLRDGDIDGLLVIHSLFLYGDFYNSSSIFS